MPTQIPNIIDYARLHPPHASIDTGRSPVIKWHATYGAAKISAQSTSWGVRERARKDDHYFDHEYYALRAHAVAVLRPNGDLEIVESWMPGAVR